MNSLKQHLSNFSVLRSPFSVLRSPFSVLRSIIVSITLLLFTCSINARAESGFLDTFFTVPDFVEDIKEGPSKLTELLTGPAGCLALGAAGYLGGKELARVVGKDELTEEEQRNFSLGLALAGCAIGAGVSTAVLDHMTEEAKKAQLAAWDKAMQNVGTPVRWSTPKDGQEGIEKLEDIEISASGEKCGFRRSVIKNSKGEVTAEQYGCWQPPNGSWEPRLG